MYAEWYQQNDPEVITDRILGYRSSRGLRRTLRGLGSAGSDAVIGAAQDQYNPARFRQSFRDDLKRTAADAALASTLNSRDEAQRRLATGAGTPEQRDSLRAVVDNAPKWGSVAARFDPRDPNSVASRFGGRNSLFRNI